MMEYFYNEKLAVLELRTNGIIKIEDIIDHYNKLEREVSLPKTLKVFIDCRDIHFDIKPEELRQTHEIIQKVLQKYDSINEAILVDKPFETVVAMLFDSYNSDFKAYSFRVFSTEDAAMAWLS